VECANPLHGTAQFTKHALFGGEKEAWTGLPGEFDPFKDKFQDEDKFYDMPRHFEPMQRRFRTDALELGMNGKQRQVSVPVDIPLMAPGWAETMRILPIPSPSPADAPAGKGLIRVSNLTGSEDFTCTFVCIAQVGKLGDILGAQTVSLDFKGAETFGNLVSTSMLAGLFQPPLPVIPEETVRMLLDLPVELSQERQQPKALCLLAREESMMKNVSGKQHGCLDDCVQKQHSIQGALPEAGELADLFRALAKKRDDEQQ
jgi:hypothetical protein